MKNRFTQQKKNAEKRGIEFEFTYLDWCAWWEEQLGVNWPNLRGCKKGQYVMARKLDEGAYARGNVLALTIEQNTVSYNKRRKTVSTAGWSPLPDEVVKAIYLDGSDYSSIAKKYDVTKHKIQCIKQKHYYKKITDTLD